MRLSLPIPLRTMFTFAPTNSHKLAMSFIKLIRVANMEFAAYLIISALGISVNSIRSFVSMKGRYRRFMISRARSLSTPTTTRSGRMKSSTAAPSFKNSGLLATSNSNCKPRLSNSSWMACRTFFAVPTGTVLLVTTTK